MNSTTPNPTTCISASGTFLKYPKTANPKPEILRKAQKHVLDMAKKTCSILEKHAIDYMLANGALLGAVRHHGFVPWDDDFDVFLFEEKYNEAIAHLKEELPQFYLIHDQDSDPLYFKAWSEVRDLRTCVIDKAPKDIDMRLLKYPCLSVDLFKIKQLNADDTEKYRSNETLAFLKRKLSLGIIDKAEYNRQKNALKYQNPQPLQGEYREHYFFLRKFSTPVHYNDTFPLQKVAFEDHLFYAPRNPDAYLRSIYGDYMKPPPFHRRHGHFVKIIFNEAIIR